MSESGPSSPRPGSENFRDTFCAQYGVPSERYTATVLRLTLYPHARCLAGVGPRDFMAPDRDFVRCVGRLTRWSAFTSEANQFQRLPANRRFHRRRLCLRVSVNRMRALFSEVMGGTPIAPAVRCDDEDQAAHGSLAG